MDFKSIIPKLKEVFKKLSNIQKMIIGGIIGFVIILLFVIMGASSSSGKYPLYGVNYKIKDQDRDKIVKALKGMKLEYEVDGEQIFVNDKETAMKVKTQLGLEGIIPQDIKSWDLFDNQPFTTTDFERKINVRRAITASIKKHLEMIDEIEGADVIISYEEDKTYFADDLKNFPLTASVVITPAPGSDIITNKKKIRGLRDLIAKGIHKLKPDNIVILDNDGNVLTDRLNSTDEELNIRLAKEQMKIKEQLRAKYVRDLRAQLSRVFTNKRFDLKVNLELNWDVKKETKSLVLPVIIKEDNPDTPYDDSITKESVAVSKKTTTEDFKGPSYIPEGPAGIEDQVPPGMKEKMDRFSKYLKNETILNLKSGEGKVDIKRDPNDIQKITVSVFLDGHWKKMRDDDGDLIIEKGSIKRKFDAVEKEKVKQVDNILRTYIGYNKIRGDKVAVQAVAFDRTEEHEKEDEEIRKSRRLKRTILAVIIGIISIFVISILYKAIEREMARRRRLREEELIKQQEALRMAALRAAEQESVSGAELSPEERARLELQENAVKVSKDHPENVAKLIRTWLSEE